MTQLKVIEGRGDHRDRAEELTQAIFDLIQEQGIGMTFAAIIGCVEIVKMELLQEARED